MKHLLYSLLFILAGILPWGLNAQPCSNPSPGSGETCQDPIDLCTGSIPVSTCGFQPDPPLVFCGGTATTENNSWVEFVAAAPMVTFDFTLSSCTNGQGVQAVIFDAIQGDCNNLVELACFNPGGAGAQDFTVSANVTPGQSYLLMIDGYAGDCCNFDVVPTGIDQNPPSPATPMIDGPLAVCEGEMATYTVTNPDPGATYIWYEPGFLGSPTGWSVDIDFTGQSGNLQICVEASVPCNPACACIDVMVEPPPNPTPNPLTLCNDDGAGGSILPYNLNNHLDEIFTGLDPGSTVNWYASLFAAQQGNPTVSPIITQPGTYTFYYDVTTPSGCTAVPPNQPVMITIEDPSINAFVLNNPYCEGECVDLSQEVQVVETSGLTNTTITFHPDEGSAMAGVLPIIPPEACWDDGINPYWVRLESQNGCYDVVPIIVEFEDIPDVIINPPPPICATFPTTFELQTLVDDEYILLLPSGNGIDVLFYPDETTANQGFGEIYPTLVDIPSAGSYTYWVVAETESGCTTEPVPITITFTEGPTVEISGSGDVCLGEDMEIEFEFTGTPPFDVELEDNHGNFYTFTFNDDTGIEFITAQDTGLCIITVTSLTDDSGSACPVSSSGTAEYQVHPLPTATITMDTTICGGTCADLTFNMTGISPFTVIYNDSDLGSDITLTNIPDGHTIQVCPDSAATYTLVSVEDSLGCYDLADDEVEVNLIPPLMVNNLQEDCNANLYTVSFDISGGEMPYMVDGDPGTLSGSAFTSDPIATLTPYQFLVTDASGCDTVEVAGSVDTCCASDAGTMNQALINACVPDTVNATHNGDEFLDNDDAMMFVLHDNNGNSLGNILATNTIPEFWYIPGETDPGVTYYISAVVGNDDGTGSVDLNDLCLSVSQGTPVVWHEPPTADLSADGEICLGDSYTLQVDFTGSGTYTFVYTDGTTEDTVTTTNNPFTFNVNPTTTTTYTLVSIRDQFCDGTLGNDQVIVTVNEAPTNTTPVYTCNGTNTEYTATFDINGGAGSGNYIVVGGGGSISGNTFTSDPLTNGSNTTIQYTDINGCDTIDVDLEHVCDCETDAGTMELDTLDFCVDETATAFHNGDEVFDGDDMLQFILHTRGDSTLGFQIDTNDTPSFTFLPGSMTTETVYYISAVAGNELNGNVDQTDLCLDVAPGQPIVFHELPTVTMSGTQSICIGESADLVFDFTGQPPYTVVYAIDGVDQTQVVTSDNPFTLPVSPASTSTYTITSIVDANCTGSGSGTVDITVNDSPTFSNLAYDCDTVTRDYIATFDISGGTQPYILVDGPGAINGSSYNSGFLPNTTMDTIRFTDVNMCDTIEVPIFRDCSCITFAGSMSTSPLVLCEDQTANQALYLGGGVQDGNDSRVFVLHTGNANELGQVIDVRLWGQGTAFPFTEPPMNFGQTYYVSAVYGNDSLGYVAFSDTCLSVAAGTPVTWYPYPDADIVSSAGTELTCDVEMITLDGSGSTGYSTIDFLWTDETGAVFGMDPSLEVNAAGTYILNVSDQVSDCSDSDTIVITDLRQDPEIDILPPPQLTCLATSVEIDASGSSSGPNYQITWTDPNGITLPNNTLTLTVTAEGTYTLTILDTTNNCEVSETVTVIANQDVPMADAGPSMSFTCIRNTATLNGSGSSQGSIFDYSWTGPSGTSNIANANTLNPVVSEVGTYILTVTNTENGCFAIDSVTVDNNNAIPNLFHSFDTISCYGDADGFIVVDSISGGTGPFSYSINGGPFSPFSGFFNLDQGTYTVVVMDANGCTDSVSVEIIEPDELIVDLGPDITINLGDSTQLNPTISEPVDSLIWSDNLPAQASDALQPWVKPTSTTTYSLTVVNSSGCKDTDYINVLVAKDRPIYIPNTFSPNNDGLNDWFHIYGDTKAVKNIQLLRIYTRWGELVYEGTDLDINDEPQGWDGRHRGDFMNPGVYVFYTEIEFVDGEIELYKGDVTLVR